jgi:NifU-like protein involved in Fe-S cluster formation/predicted Fe-Mo cluster-binding NifX family protein
MAATVFSEVAWDHATRPRNRGPLARHHGHARITGPCGDTMEVWLRIEDERVADISFETDGCGSSLACGSMATCLAAGAPVEQARALSQQDVLDALGDFPPESEHCALLASITVRAAAADYQRAISRGDPTAIQGVIEDAGRLPREQHDKEASMRIAIPLAGEELSAHFGHCQSFALVDVDTDDKRIVTREDVAAPPHEPGLLPAWLGERGAHVIIAGGMGQRAQSLFADQGIEVVVGVPAATPEELASDYLAGELRGGANSCDH